MLSSIANSYVISSLGLAVKTLGDVLAFLWHCGFFLLAASVMLCRGRLTPGVGFGRFLLGMIRRRSQPA
jgi:hypothetical protein